MKDNWTHVQSIFSQKECLNKLKWLTKLNEGIVKLFSTKYSVKLAKCKAWKLMLVFISTYVDPDEYISVIQWQIASLIQREKKQRAWAGRSFTFEMGYCCQWFSLLLLLLREKLLNISFAFFSVDILIARTSLYWKLTSSKNILN